MSPARTAIATFEGAGRLVFEVYIMRSRRERIAASVISAGAAGMALWSVLAHPLTEALSLIIGAAVLWTSGKRRRFILEVSRVELVSRGAIGDAFGKRRDVSVAEVERLEYRGDESGPDSGASPAGLYAVVGRRAVCLLPGLEPAQVEEVVARIDAAFPHFEDLRRRHAASRHSALTSLNLSD